MGQLNLVDANRIKFEARFNPPPDAPKKGSKFGRFLRAFGMVAAPVGYASSLFFPPAALIGAAAYGLGQVGGHKDATKRREETPAAAPAVFFPGVGTPVGGPTATPISYDVADPMDVMVDRQAATNEMIKVK